MSAWSLLLCCGGAPAVPSPPPPAAPRSPEEARAALARLGWRASCEGGVLGDGPSAEISYECTADGPAGHLSVSGVTTALPLPAPSEGAARHVGDLWVEASVSPGPGAPADPSASEALLRQLLGP